MKRRRLQYGTGILFVSFLVVTICFGTILHLVDQMEKNRIMDNALYSRNQREFAIVSTENEDLWQEVIPRISKEWNGVMYLPIESSDIIVRGIYTSGDSQHLLSRQSPRSERIIIVKRGFRWIDILHYQLQKKSQKA